MAVLAVVAAVLLVAVRWDDLVPPPTPELPSHHLAKRPVAAVSLSPLAYHEEDSYEEDTTWRLLGYVIDDAGAPVADASVSVRTGCFRMVAEPEELPVVHTGTDGRFAIDVLPVCSFWIHAAKGDRSARLMTPTLPTQPLTLQLAPNNDLLLHVVDAVTHAPVPFVHATEMFCKQGACSEADGGSDGVVHIPRGNALRLAAQGYADTWTTVDIWPGVDEPPPLLERTVEMYAFHRVVGRVLGPRGEPLAGVHIQTSSPGPYQLAAPPQATAITDASGSFELVVSDRSWIYLGGGCVDGHDYRSREYDVIVAGGARVEFHVDRITTCTPHVPPPPRPQPPSPPPPPPPPETEVVVNVVDEANRPVPHAELWTFDNWFMPVRADAAGRHVLHVREPLKDFYARRGQRISPVTLIEAGGGHREYTLRMQPAAITGTVVDGDGKRVAKAWLRVRLPFLQPPPHEPNYREIRTDSDGRFGFVLPPGRYLISAFRETSIEDDYDAPNARVIATDTRDVTFEIP